MPLPSLPDLDLSLAWRRAKYDHDGRCFVTHPKLLAWIAVDEEAWVSSVRAELTEGYNPRDAALCWAPKAGGLGRPGKVLDVSDELVYNALLTAAYPYIWTALRHLQGDPSVANQLQDPTRSRWVRSGARVRTEWRNRSLEKAEDTRCSWMVSGDIAGFYDNIDHRLLQTALTRVDVPVDVVNAIIACLRRWSHPMNRGIPQGYSASDILATLFLGTFDEMLLQLNVPFLRYVDDLRFFCSSRVQAKEVLAQLSRLLFERGLTPQSGKTRIDAREAALLHINGVGPILEAVHARLGDELLIVYGRIGQYGTVTELRRLAAANPNSAPPPVLEQTFREHFGASIGVEFDATLFHFLLNRLGAALSRVAVEYCLHVLQERPEETEHVLRYFHDVGITDSECESILSYAGTREAVYDYQLYQICTWFYSEGRATEQLLALCRRWAYDRNRAPWLRSYAFLLLGRFGGQADLERLEATYPSATTDLERAELITALARMPAVRRNGFYSTVRRDGLLVSTAVRVAQQQG